MKKVVERAVKMVISLSMAIVIMIVGGLGVGETVYAYTSVSGVPKVAGITDDIFRGVDISSVLALEESGVKFSYLDGTQGDIFDILAGAGVNYARIRIWNNPYEAEYPYKGYGGGNCTLYTAKVLGKRATDAGMKVFIDFHYSDFWTDPAKHYAPKAWADYNLQEKKDAVYNFTYQSLCELIDYGVDIGMVQIGNETNGSLCGVGGFSDDVWDLSSGVAELMQQGCYAINDINSKYGRSILKVLHFTRLLADGEWYAEQLSQRNVDYDVYAASFYPMWDGTASEMIAVLKNIVQKYNKKVMVAETAYPYTFDDADGSMNNINGPDAMRYYNYAVTMDGQAQALYDVFDGIAQINAAYPGYGLGVFYWEPSWIGVPKETWGTYGTGWASSVSQSYEDLFVTGGSEYSTTDQGSSWDNMTLFDADGKATKVLYVFNDIRGAVSTTSPN